MWKGMCIVQGLEVCGSWMPLAHTWALLSRAWPIRPISPGAVQIGRRCILRTVVFQKWRWTENTVTLGLTFVASLRKEWPMTFIAVRCPHCQSDQIVKRGKTARGTQRYLCQNTLCARGSFLLDYCNRGCLPEVKRSEERRVGKECRSRGWA